MRVFRIHPQDTLSIVAAASAADFTAVPFYDASP